MNIPVSDAKGLLTDLVRQAEGGEDIMLTRRSRPVVRLLAVHQRPTQSDRRAILNAARAEGRQRAIPGPSADHSQDFLYGDDGLPP